MFTSHIKEAKRLNRLDLSSQQGRHHVHYSKSRNLFSLIFSCLMVLFFLGCCFFLHWDEKDGEKTLAFLFISFFTIFMLVDSIFESIGRLLLNNPVFILKGELLYYTHSNRPYDIRNYTFSEEYEGRYNWYGTFCMFHRNGEKEFGEKNWHLENEEGFKSQLRYHLFLLSGTNNR